jgi:hypothetical protein
MVDDGADLCSIAREHGKTIPVKRLFRSVTFLQVRYATVTKVRSSHFRLYPARYSLYSLPHGSRISGATGFYCNRGNDGGTENHGSEPLRACHCESSSAGWLKKPCAFNSGELWMVDLDSGRTEAVLPGVPISEFDISPDGQHVTFAALDAEGDSHVWVAPLDRHAPPKQLTAITKGNQR